MSELKKAFNKQSQICAESSVLYRDMIEIFGNYDPALDFIEKEIKPNRIFSGQYEIVLTFIAFFHYQVLTGKENGTLQKFFRTHGGSYSDKDYAGLKKTLLKTYEENLSSIKEWMLRVILQTNEVNRCNAIFPAILSLDSDYFNLIELGCSAGLIMLMDLYGYRFYNEQDSVIFNPDNSPVLNCYTNSSDKLRVLFNRKKEIGKRIGLDLNPVDLSKQENELLLKAVLWDDPERNERLEKSIDLFRKAEEEKKAPILLKYDYTNDLTSPLKEHIDNNGDLVFYTSVSTYQIPQELYEALFVRLKQVSEFFGRKTYLIEYESARTSEDTINITSEEPFQITVNRLHDGKSHTFGRAHFHGRSLTVF